MPGPRGEEARARAVDELHARVLAAGTSVPELKGLLGEPIEEQVLVAVLRRAVPGRFLELVATTEPWSERPRILARVVLNARAPRALSLRLISQLAWRELADVAATAWVPGAVRLRAEALLRDTLRDLRVGDRITLARMATPTVLPLLVVDEDSRVIEAALLNPRLREEDLLTAVSREDVPRALLEASVSSPRWTESYALKLALVLQKRTPLSVALHQIRSLVPRDLKRVAEARDLRPVVCAAARGVLDKGGDSDLPNPRRLN